jgi:uncharacterized membrane protein YphA (DoxX/SURF4 family)
MDIWEIGEWVGRIGLLAVFVRYGINHFANHAAMTAYAQSKKVPAPGFMVLLTGAMMLVGSAMVLARWHAIWGCALLVTFVGIVALWMHDFWSESDPMARANQEAHFWKNVSMAAGATLYAVALHRGAW